AVSQPVTSNTTVTRLAVASSVLAYFRTFLMLSPLSRPHCPLTRRLSRFVARGASHETSACVAGLERTLLRSGTGGGLAPRYAGQHRPPRGDPLLDRSRHRRVLTAGPAQVALEPGLELGRLA